MNHDLVLLFSFSISIPAFIGLVRFTQIRQAYWPFIFFLWIGLVNEVCSLIIVKSGHSNAINNNIYVLIESILILLFFHNLGLFGKQRYLFFILLGLFIGSWMIENTLISRIDRFSSYFRILYSFAIVLMSVTRINQLIGTDKHNHERRSEMLILIGFITFFTYKTLVEIFWVYGLNSSRSFRVEVYRIMVYINLTVNFIYAAAALWIPRKPKSLLP